MDTVDPLYWVYLVGGVSVLLTVVGLNISSRRFDRKFGRERDGTKAP